MALKKQGTNKNLLILGAIILVTLAAILAYGYSASQKNKEMAEQAAAYTAQKEAKAKAEVDQAAERKRKFDNQQQAWGKLTPEEQEKASLDHRFEQTRIAREKEDAKSGVTKVAMGFSDCRDKLNASILAVAGSTRTDLIVNSSEMIVGRICTNDGSVLVTCSKPDGTMITQKSDFTGCT